MPSRHFTYRLSLFNAVLFLGSGIQLPFLPLWLKERGLPDAEVTLVVGLMMAVRIVGIPVGTFIADLTRQRRTVIVVCAFGSTLSYLMMAAMAGFWPILICGMLAAALMAPVVPLSEVLAIEGSAHYGIDYGRIRLWASLSFLTGSLGAGALLELIPVGSVILLIAMAQALGALATLLLPQDRAVRAATKVEPIRLAPFLALALLAPAAAVRLLSTSVLCCFATGILLPLSGTDAALLPRAVAGRAPALALALALLPLSRAEVDGGFSDVRVLAAGVDASAFAFAELQELEPSDAREEALGRIFGVEARFHRPAVYREIVL